MNPQIPKRRASTVKKSFDIYGHYTSVSLEAEFWDALQEIARARDQSVRSIVLKVDEERLKRASIEVSDGVGSNLKGNLSDNSPPSNLSSRLRVYILNYYRTM